MTLSFVTVNIKLTRGHLVIGKPEMCWNRLELLISKLLNSRKHRIRLAIVIIVVYTIIATLFIPTIVLGYWNIVSAPKKNSFDLPLRINLNGTRSFNITISFGLKIKYYKEILVANEPMDINGVAIMDDNSFNISRIQFGFQNSLAYNKTTRSVITDQWEIPLQGALIFAFGDTAIGEDGKIVYHMTAPTTTITFPVDGNFKPLLGIFYQQGDTNTTMLIEDVAITIFPKGQLTQIQTNKVTSELSIAVFIFSLFGVISAIMDLTRYEAKPIITQELHRTLADIQKLLHNLNNKQENSKNEDQ
jgi:hypothetical protein